MRLVISRNASASSMGKSSISTPSFIPVRGEAGVPLGGREIDQPAGNEERRDAARAAVDQLGVLALDQKLGPILWQLAHTKRSAGSTTLWREQPLFQVR